MLLVALLASTQLAHTFVVDDAVAPASDAAVSRTWLWAGASGATRLGAGGQMSGQLALSYRLTDWFEPEALMAFGAFADPSQSGFEIVDRFSFGARVLFPIAHVRPFVWLALRHEHQVQSAAWLKEPLTTTLGFSEKGVRHKTGAELALGTDVLIPIDDTPVVAAVRIGATALPSFGSSSHSDQLGLFVDLSAGLPLSL